MAIQSSFRRTLVLISSTILLAACSSNQPSVENNSTTESTETKVVNEGLQLFQANCVTCHGADGKLGLSGAKDLSKSALSASEMNTVIQNGRNGMPSFEGIIPDGPQLDSLISVVLSLRK